MMGFAPRTLRSNGCAPRLIADNGHLADDAAWPACAHVEHIAIILFHDNANTLFLNEVGACPCVYLGHDYLTGLEEFFSFQCVHTLLHLVGDSH
jgi:hypothetical protein